MHSFYSFMYILSSSTNTTVIKIKFHISTTFQLNSLFYPLVQWARSRAIFPHFLI
ncbi:unnamed protein product [Meloidogyne enterolobii]|uniref:Uncharacterized protein n=1 Tax=Meloidogyne enterolobii TaxID=390850 RepID=A0ACB1AI90_MELEN